MPTVLHVSQPTGSGVGSYVAGVCIDQAERGWDVIAACPSQGQLADELSRRGIARIAWEAGRAPGPGVLGESLRLRRVMELARPDVVHLHSSKAGLAGRMAARGRLPTLFQPHGWSWLAAPRGMVRAAQRWERHAARWTTLFVCVGEGEAAHGRSQSINGPYSVVHNGINLERFRPATPGERLASRHRLGLPPEAPLALCVGRITRQKGQDLLLSAWPQVRAQEPGARLALLGAGELPEPLR